MGGGLALMLAADDDFSMASVNYGGLTPNSQRALPRASPIVASYGAEVGGQVFVRSPVYSKDPVAWGEKVAADAADNASSRGREDRRSHQRHVAQHEALTPL